MIKSVSKFLIICMIMLNILTIQAVYAENGNTIKLPKNTRLITEFDKFPTGVTINGEFFFGILISEMEFDKITNDAIELAKLKEQIQIYKNFDKTMNELFDKYHNTTNQHIDDIKDILNKPQRISFWDQNKTWIMFIAGIAVGVATYKVATL